MDLVRIAGGSIEVDVLPAVGARLHRLTVYGHDLLRTPTDPREHARDPFSWGSYVMAPWCNRVAAGSIAIGGRLVDLGANFPDGTAIHGQVYARPWTVDGESSSGADAEGARSFSIRGGGGGWPWDYEVRQRVVTSGATLRLEYSLTNVSQEPMPAGIGIHPWFLRPLRLAIHAERVHEVNTAAEREPGPVGGRFDLRRVRDVPDDLDGCWTDVADPAVELEWPAAGVRATMRAAVGIATGERPGSMRVDAGRLLHVVMASPRALDAVGVEPQTNAPQGLRRFLDGAPGGLVALDPGKRLRLDVALAFERADAAPVPRAA
jgi:aldose 1-epimerase